LININYKIKSLKELQLKYPDKLKYDGVKYYHSYYENCVEMNAEISKTLGKMLYVKMHDGNIIKKYEKEFNVKVELNKVYEWDEVYADIMFIKKSEQLSIKNGMWVDSVYDGYLFTFEMVDGEICACIYEVR